jgi:hypothetical protein
MLPSVVMPPHTSRGFAGAKSTGAVSAPDASRKPLVLTCNLTPCATQISAPASIVRCVWMVSGSTTRCGPSAAFHDLVPINAPLYSIPPGSAQDVGSLSGGRSPTGPSQARRSAADNVSNGANARLAIQRIHSTGGSLSGPVDVVQPTTLATMVHIVPSHPGRITSRGRSWYPRCLLAAAPAPRHLWRRAPSRAPVRDSTICTAAGR